MTIQVYWNENKTRWEVNSPLDLENPAMGSEVDTFSDYYKALAYAAKESARLKVPVDILEPVKA